MAGSYAYRLVESLSLVATSRNPTASSLLARAFPRRRASPSPFLSKLTRAPPRPPQLIAYAWGSTAGAVAWLFEAALKVFVLAIVGALLSAASALPLFFLEALLSLSLLLIGAVINVFRPGDPSKSGAVDRRTADAFRHKLWGRGTAGVGGSGVGGRSHGVSSGFRLDERIQEEERARRDYYAQLALGKVTMEGSGAGAAGSAAGAGRVGAIGSADGVWDGDREDGPLLGNQPRRASATGLFGRRGSGGAGPTSAQQAKRKWRAATAAALVSAGSRGHHAAPAEPPGPLDEAMANLNTGGRAVSKWFLKLIGRRTTSVAG
eukprot:tig00000269_g23719.t1